MTALAFYVNGMPGAQGSKVAFQHRHTGKTLTRESSAKVKPWRTDVKTAAEAALLASDHWQHAHDGPVAIVVWFRFLRPKSHHRTGRNAHLLREAAPDFPTGRDRGDIDKLTRSTLDALVAAGVMADDSLVAELHARKVWARPGETSGAMVTVTTLGLDEIEVLQP